MHGDVVPGRHHLAVLGLCRVPGGTDIGVRAGEDHQRFGAFGQVAPVRIGAGEVPVEGAELALAGLQQQRQVAGQQTLGAGTGEDGQAARLHLPMELGEVILAEGAGDVHGGSPGGMLPC
ncbi:hypothetical protein D3C76_1021550 [compost metagenome]